MRELVVLRGLPGSGKSTFLKYHNLEKYTLSPDTIRLMVAGTGILLNDKTGFKESLLNTEDKYVWKLFFEMLEKRMEKGLFTVLDATHTKESYFNDYNKLCDKYRYRMIIIEFDVKPEDAKLRNLMRPSYKIVPDEVIDRMYQQMKNPLPEKYKKYIVDAKLFTEMKLNPYSIDLNQYEGVHIVGDIHSCFTALKQDLETSGVLLPDGTINPNQALIFTGDYIDRGIEPIETINFLFEIKDLPNVYFLLGNHEIHIEKYMRNNKDTSCIGYARETIKTLKTLGEEGSSKLRQLVRKCRTHLIVNYNNQVLYITHGGIPEPIKDITQYSANELINGIGDYVDAQKVDELFNNNCLSNEFSIHAHRNINCVCDIKSSEHTFNLCDDVEHGGFLRSVSFYKDSQE